MFISVSNNYEVFKILVQYLLDSTTKVFFYDAEPGLRKVWAFSNVQSSVVFFAGPEPETFGGDFPDAYGMPGDIEIS